MHSVRPWLLLQQSWSSITRRQVPSWLLLPSRVDLSHSGPVPSRVLLSHGITSSDTLSGRKLHDYDYAVSLRSMRCWFLLPGRFLLSD